ncbi:MAG: RagB/SusD family nutrient uptake outer membrane protein [Muribaculaceae bacterium]|nr:RagB/SusD family nutrient uptake outer membrane protein [Muribaculaceae bacterium]
MKMKLHFKHIALPTVFSIIASVTTGCLDEAFPEDGTITSGMIAGADKSALAAAIPSYFNAAGDENWDIGFNGFMMFYDAMTADYPVYDNSWDYFHYFNLQISIGNNGISQGFWVRHYYMIQKANSLIAACDREPGSHDANYLGIGLTYRAFCFEELTKLFEYRRTNVARLDDIADDRGLWGLTCPIVTENTTEAESRKNPRAPFYEMYRFINNDLLDAEKYLADYHSSTSKDQPCLGVAYGLHARLWLNIATRFELHPEDLALQLDNEDNESLATYEKLGIKTANDCYRKAAEYARLAINEGFTPLNKSDWYNKSTGFNTPNNSWMWAILLTSNDSMVKNNTWKTLPSFKSPECTYGMASLSYNCYRLIDARLYSKMDVNDWRRDTWISPDYAAMGDSDEKLAEFNATYAANTNYDYETFNRFGAYAGFKFRPASGDGKNPTVGNAMCTPLMRVEEMYLIEAEALAHCDGAAAGKAAIENFMNTYRMKEGTTFTCPSSQIDDVIDIIWTQKRIELWGEGRVLDDYKRRELAITRGYPGTNHVERYRYNSYPMAVAPWTNFYIPDRVETQNHAVVLNPDPIQAIPTLWEE